MEEQYEELQPVYAYTLISDQSVAEELMSATCKPTMLSGQYLFTGLLDGGEHITKEQAIEWKDKYAPPDSDSFA